MRQREPGHAEEAEKQRPCRRIDGPTGPCGEDLIARGVAQTPRDRRRGVPPIATRHIGERNVEREDVVRSGAGTRRHDPGYALAIDRALPRDDRGSMTRVVHPALRGEGDELERIGVRIGVDRRCELDLVHPVAHLETDGRPTPEVGDVEGRRDE